MTDAIQVLRDAFDGSHNWYQGTIADVTEEQANTLPPGTAHPIGALALHILNSEDAMINGAVLGQQPIWFRDGWGEKLGVPALLMQDNETSRGVRVSPAALQPYAQAVYANTAEFLDGLSPADLDDRKVDMSEAGLGVMPLGKFLTQALLGNNYAHTGEISALKGVLGAKGYPF